MLVVCWGYMDDARASVWHMTCPHHAAVRPCQCDHRPPTRPRTCSLARGPSRAGYRGWGPHTGLQSRVQRVGATAEPGTEGGGHRAALMAACRPLPGARRHSRPRCSARHGRAMRVPRAAPRAPTPTMHSPRVRISQAHSYLHGPPAPPMHHPYDPLHPPHTIPAEVNAPSLLKYTPQPLLVSASHSPSYLHHAPMGEVQSPCWLACTNMVEELEVPEVRVRVMEWLGGRAKVLGCTCLCNGVRFMLRHRFFACRSMPCPAYACLTSYHLRCSCFHTRVSSLSGPPPRTCTRPRALHLVTPLKRLTGTLPTGSLAPP